MIPLILLGLVFLLLAGERVIMHGPEYANRAWGPRLLTLAGQYSIPYSILEAMITIESSGDENALSQSGAVGLMQVKAIVLREFNTESGSIYPESALYDPRVNIEVGVWYLHRLMTVYGFRTIRLALLAYANGIGNVERGTLSDPDYADKVLTLAGRYA